MLNTISTKITSDSTQDLHEKIPANHLVFIDSKVEKYQTLVAGVLANTSVVVLDNERDGIEQINQVLASHRGVNSLHIVSHGAPGRVYLGNSQLNNETLNHYAAQLMGWASALSTDAQLLLYGCEVAQTEQGMAFVQRLSELTGAVVAASDNLTGSTALGGDWKLEVNTGVTVPSLAFQPEVMAAYVSVLAVVLPDSSFGGDGKVTTDLGFIAIDIGRSVGLQKDGKIIVAGDSNGDFALVRYNTDGSLDTTFSSNGKVTTGFGLLSIDIGYSLAIQPDGKILVAGTDGTDFALARYNSDGSLDTTFSSDGKVTTGFGLLSIDIGHSVAVQPDGKILVAGTDGTDFALARYNTNGSLDTTFSSDGKVTTDLGFIAVDVAYSTAVQADGKILVAGVSNGDFALVRYNSNGSLDTTFSSDGKVTTDFGLLTIDSIYSLVVQADGKILVAGQSNGDFALARYNSDGSLDTSFSSDGKVTTEFGLLPNEIIYSLAVQPDGKILAAGVSNNDFALVRYNSDGSIDTTFDNDGKVSTDLGLLTIDIAYGLVQQPDGKIIVAGTDGTDFAVVRYLVDEVPTDLALSQFNVDENVPPATVVGTFTTTDADVGDTFTYSLVTGTGDTDNSAFIVTGTQLKINSSPDFETKSSYNIRVQATDSSGQSYSKELTIIVNNLDEAGNDAPTDLALSPSNVNENVTGNTVVGTFTTTDPDVGDTFTYTLVTGTGNADNNAFTVTGTQLKINSSPDFETKSSYNIRVRTTDATGAFFDKELTIIVNNLDDPGVNDAPTSLALSQVTVNENVPAGTAVGTFTTTDPDVGDTFTYSLVTGTGDTDNSAFTVTGTQLKINSSPDFETKSSYNIRVRTTDATGAFFDKELTIAVNNLNDAPTGLALSQVTVNENVPAGTAVGTFTTTDPDVGDTFTYSLVTGTGNTDNSAFTVTGNQLKINSSPDFETKSSYNIRVRTTDVTGAFFDKELTIIVNNLDDPGVNDAPTDLVLSQSNVDENVPAGTVVGTFTTTDPDAVDTFTYSLVAGTGDSDNSAFTVTGNQLKINSSPDFETKSSYKIRVQTADASGATYSKELTIAVGNLNDAPTNLTVSKLAVDENVPAGTVVGTFTTTDPDPIDTFTYSLVAGTGDSDNSAFTVTGNQLKINSSPDFETKSSYKIRVRTTDATGASFDKELAIAVNNLDDPGVNDAPTDVTVSKLAVDENVPAGTVVGTFITSDPDPVDTFTYSLVTGTGDTDNGAFSVTGNQLKINSSPDFETKSSYNIRVQTTDASGAIYSKELTIAVNNLDDPGVNDAPTDVTVSKLAVDENVPAGTVVGTFITSDPDPVDTFTYSLVTGTGDTDNGAFSVTGNQLKINSSPDFETKSSYKIRVQTTDASGAIYSKELTIAVNNLDDPGVNDAPTDLTVSKLAVDENVPAGTVVGTFITSDPDPVDTFTYSLVTGTGDTDNGAFSVTGNQLKINSSPDFETKSSYNIRVQTTDASGATYSKELTIAVNNLDDPGVNDAPTDVTVSKLAVDENVPAGTVVGTFITSDPDPVDTFTYSLVTGTGDTDNGAFSVTGNQLKINSSPDFETKSSYKIRVQTTDASGAIYSKELTIAVNNLDDPGVNDAPTDLTVSKLAVDENVPAGTVVGTFITSDPDPVDTFTYSLVTGTGDTDNGAFSVTGNQLKINSSPDFETKSSYNIRVQTTDASGATYSKELTIAVNNLDDPGVNDAPTDVTVSKLAVDENVPAGTVVGTFITSDPDPVDTFTYSLVTGTGDTDNGAFSVTGNQLKINSSPDFETKSSYNIRVRTTDATGASFDKELAIAVNNLDDSGVNDLATLTKNANDIFTIKGKGNSEKATLSVTLTGQSPNEIYELGVFVVDDEQGKIQGIASSDPGYTEAALKRSKVILSSLTNYPTGFNADLNSLAEFTSGEQLRFYLVRNDTSDSVLAGQAPLNDVLIADSTNLKTTSLGNNNFSLSWKGSNSNEFSDLVVQIQTTDEDLPLGAASQGNQQRELLDLSGVTQPVKADFVVYREASYNNYVSFYKVTDENGGIDTNGDGTADIFVGQAGYTQAAVRGRVAGTDLTVNNQGIATSSRTFEADSLYAPLIIVNGRPDAILDGNANNDPKVYFAFLGANSDKTDHIRLLENNTFGFEDLTNAGDKDFNDMIVKVNLSVNAV